MMNLQTWVASYRDESHAFNNAWFLYFDELRKLAGTEGRPKLVCPQCGSDIVQIEVTGAIDAQECSKQCGWQTVVRDAFYGGGEESLTVRGELVGTINMRARTQRERTGEKPVVERTTWGKNDVTSTAYPLFGKALTLSVNPNSYRLRQAFKLDPQKYINYVKFLRVTRPPEITEALSFDNACDMAKNASPVGRCRIERGI